MNKLIILFIAVFIGISCKSNKQQEATTTQTDSLSITKQNWGKAGDQDVFLYTLKNKNATTVKIATYGGIITELHTKDKNDSLGNIVLGFDSIGGYLNKPPYFGALIGRYANRIGGAKFKLDGKEYKLSLNDGKNTLHGGNLGFDKKVWTATELISKDSVGLQLTYVSADMEEGYPGTLTSTVTYVLNDNDELKIYYSAETDKPTIVNLTNHSYFNLNGGKESILSQSLVIYSDSITPVDANLIPTGKVESIAGTAFDFKTPHTIGERIAQIKGGYDHNYIASKPKGTYGKVAEVTDSISGRVLEMYTTEPGVQFYSGNFLEGNFVGVGNIAYNQYWGYCLEAQHYPDSPNKPQFPSVVLRPGEKYYQLTTYKFGVKK